MVPLSFTLDGTKHTVAMGQHGVGSFPHLQLVKGCSKLSEPHAWVSLYDVQCWREVSAPVVPIGDGFAVPVWLVRMYAMITVEGMKRACAALKAGVPAEAMATAYTLGGGTALLAFLDEQDR